MNKACILKRMLSLALSLVLMFSMTAVRAENDLSQKTLNAAFGTPEIDGQIDEVWDKTEYTFIDRLTPSGDNSYTGWMKALWDLDKVYVLAKIYTIQLSAPENVVAWNHDCLEIFVDENCARTTTTEDDDYQLRSNYAGTKTAKNYEVDSFDAATTTFDMGFVVEMAFPMKSVVLTENLEMGFDAQVYRTSNFAFDAARIGWSAYRSDISTNTSDYGTLVLKKSIDVPDVEIPEFELPVYENYDVSTIPYTSEMTLISDVNAMYNGGDEKNVSVLHVNEYPCMEINALADLIGAAVSDGNTLVKDDISVTYTAGERLMKDKKGNLIMLTKATLYDGGLYVPLSSLETTFLYDIKYNRFAKELDILPFNEPKQAEFVAYVKDYGAVGDGVTDDKEALVRAFNAAVNSGKPSRVELEEGKTYYIGETTDCSHMFWIAGMSDFVFAGNGATLKFSASNFKAFNVTTSQRIRIENLTIDRVVPVSTQGWIRGTNTAEATILVEFEEDYPILPTVDWHKSCSQDQLYLSPIQKDRSYSKDGINMDYAEISGFEHVEGRLYKAYMNTQGANMIPLVEEGDRFVANYSYYMYDLNKWSKPNWGEGMFNIATSGDVEFKNINVSVGVYFGCTISNTWGNVRLDNFSATNDDGNIWSNARDFVHTDRVRGTTLWQNSTVIGNGDDITNTKHSHVLFESSLGDRKYLMQSNGSFAQGDEILVFNPDDREVIGRAFVEEVEYTTSALNNEKCWIKLDRDIEGLEAGTTVALNIDTSNAGTVVRNNVFKHGKRWAWVNRSPNCVFEDNYSENMNGSMVAAENEIYHNEAPFPSAMTIRNNRYYHEGNGVTTSDPIQVRSYGAGFGDTAAVDGILIEGNTLESSRVGTMIRISDVNELYLINNKIINHGQNTSSNMPITIKNSVISMVDGIDIQYDYAGVEAGVNVAGCEYDESNIKNISISGGNMQAFKDWWN